MRGAGATSTDSSGGGNNGTLVNSPSWVSGKVGGALSFNGTNQYASLGDITPLQFERTNSFSGSFWIKISSFQQSSIFSKMNSANGYDLGLLESNGTVMDVFLSNTWTTNAFRARATFASPVADNNWHYIVTTYNGSSQNTGVKIYIDGNLATMSYVQENSLSGSILQPGVYASIGSRSDGQLFKGQIDEVRIYNRALSAAEIMALYNATK